MQQTLIYQGKEYLLKVKKENSRLIVEIEGEGNYSSILDDPSGIIWIRLCKSMERKNYYRLDWYIDEDFIIVISNPHMEIEYKYQLKRLN